MIFFFWKHAWWYEPPGNPLSRTYSSGRLRYVHNVGVRKTLCCFQFPLQINWADLEGQKAAILHYWIVGSSLITSVKTFFGSKTVSDSIIILGDDNVCIVMYCTGWNTSNISLMLDEVLMAILPEGINPGPSTEWAAWTNRLCCNDITTISIASVISEIKVWI